MFINPTATTTVTGLRRSWSIAHSIGTFDPSFSHSVGTLGRFFHMHAIQRIDLKNVMLHLFNNGPRRLGTELWGRIECGQNDMLEWNTSNHTSVHGSANHDACKLQGLFTETLRRKLAEDKIQRMIRRLGSQLHFVRRVLLVNCLDS